MPGLPEARPEAWAFGATRAHADVLLELVLAGVKTGTAGALWEYEADGDPVPEVGELSIILDADGAPQALIETTDVSIVPFDRVDADHAASEGEGDRTLEHWREVHGRFWRTYARMAHPFAADMPVVCERFRLVLAAGAPRP
nr:ASCH domain-containing protein [Demequina mangrovi]